MAERSAQYQQALALLDEARRFIECGLEERLGKLTEHQGFVVANTHLLAGLTDDVLRLAGAAGHYNVWQYRDAAGARRAEVESRLAAARRMQQEFARSRDHSLLLAQELRQTAARILENIVSDECPLCHTRFEAGELARRMAVGTNEDLEAQGQELLSEVHREEEALERALAVENGAKQLVEVCEAAELPDGTTMGEALAMLRERKDEVETARGKVEVLKTELNDLALQGLSRERLDQVRAEMRSVGLGSAHTSDEEALRRTRSEIEQHLARSLNAVSETRQEERARRQEFVVATSGLRISPDDPRVGLKELRERLAITREVLSGIGHRAMA